MTKPFRLLVRIKNNRLVKAREDLGLSMAAAARAIGIGVHCLMRYENLQQSPLADGEWRREACMIAEWHGLSPEFLWPEEVAMVRKSAMRLEIGAGEARALQRAPDQMLEVAELNDYLVTRSMTPRERKYVRERIDGATLEECGARDNLSRERVRQIMNQGLARARLIAKRRLNLLPDGEAK